MFNECPYVFIMFDVFVLMFFYVVLCFSMCCLIHSHLCCKSDDFAKDIRQKTYKTHEKCCTFFKNQEFQRSGEACEPKSMILAHEAGRLTWPQSCFEAAELNFLTFLIRI